MVAGSGALCPVAQRVLGAALTAVLGMGEGSGASMQAAGRAPREAPTSARRMVVGRGALGLRASAKNSPGEGVASALHTATWHRKGRRTRPDLLGPVSSTGLSLLLPQASATISHPARELAEPPNASSHLRGLQRGRISSLLMSWSLSR